MPDGSNRILVYEITRVGWFKLHIKIDVGKNTKTHKRCGSE